MTQKVWLGLFIIFIYEGFWGLYEYPYWVMCLCLLPCLALFMNKADEELKRFWGRKIFLFFLLSIIINLYFSYVNRHQSPLSVLSNPEFLYYLYFFSFFLFININFSIEDIETIIKICYFSFLPCYFLEFFVFYPNPVFKLLALTEDEHRFRMVGQLIGFIGYFYYLNKALLSKGVIDFVWAFLGVVFILLLGFRTHLAALAVASLFMILKIKGVSFKIVKYVLVVVLMALAVVSTRFGTEIVENIVNRQETQTLDDEDYIRVAQFLYFTEEHFISTTDFLFGSGIPSGKNPYAKSMEVKVGLDLEPTQWRDWGLLGLSWMMGLPLLLVLLYFIIKMIIAKVPNQYCFISATYLELLLVSLLNIEFYRDGAYVFHGLLLCLIYQIGKSEQCQADGDGIIQNPKVQ